jgi:hypothetical protein
VRYDDRESGFVKLTPLLLAVLSWAACRSGPSAVKEDIYVFKQVGSWSGRGNAQTETFTSDTGGFRVRWETRNEAPQGNGRFKVIFRSGDSGRPIIEAVDFHGVGRSTAEVADDVRWYYITVESANVDWSVNVDERLRGRAVR